jgi:hypothetical protein
LPVNPDEILIFKMRGMKTVQGVQQLQPVAAPAAPQVQVEERQRRPLFAPKPKQAPREKAPQRAEEQPQEEAVIPLEQPSEEEKKMQELEELEEQARLYETRKGLEVQIAESRAGKSVTVVSVFSRMSGIFFIITALTLAYSIYPQAIFVASYLIKTAPSNLWVNWNLGYAISLINAILVVFSAVGGLMMFRGVKNSEIMCSFTGAVMLLITSFEYLNSNASYTLIVSIFTFVSIISLAYARMSAVSVIERELPTNAEISWPRIETF